MNTDLTVCPLHGPGSVPGCSGVFQGVFPWLIILCQLALSQRDRKWLDLLSMAPHNLHPTIAGQLKYMYAKHQPGNLAETETFP